MDAGVGHRSSTAVLADVRTRVDGVLARELATRREGLADLAAPAGALVDEIARLVGAGGSRIRPLLCWLAFRAAGGPDGEPILRAAAALELFHTFALVHDDLVDGAVERRGVASSAVALEATRPTDTAPGFGRSAALLVGDLAFVVAVSMLRTAGFDARPTDAALAILEGTAAEMAAGQIVGLVREGGADPAREARLRGGAYTAQAPLAIGAELAGADRDTRAWLDGFGRDLGVAFQWRDDLDDGDAAAGVDQRGVDARVDAALVHIPAHLDPDLADAFRVIAQQVRGRR